MSKDTLFKSAEAPAAFTFNHKVAEVFDDMLQRSVPTYQQVTELSAALLQPLLRKDDLVYDLGCSTGLALLQLASSLQQDDLHFIGLDNSEAMVAKAKVKAEMYQFPGRMDFQLADITTSQLQPCGAVLLNYTMQFIRPLARPPFLKNIHQALRPGGALIMAEKIISPNPQVNQLFIEQYHQFKRQQGYSELEIARKREALENILIPFSIEENKTLLLEAGFQACETFYQWCNFAAFMAVKGESA